MDKKHNNELIMLSQEIYDATNAKLKAYFEKTYAASSPNTMEQQLEDWLFVAEETGAYSLGNVLAMLDPESQEAEIKIFVENLHRIIETVQRKANDKHLPN